MERFNFIKSSIWVIPIILLCFNVNTIYATGSSNSTSESHNNSETIVSYAMSWNENPNIPYAYDGPGRGKTLEECDKDKLGTDCSGFVSSVYMHFGINILGTSEDIKAKSISTTTKEDEAMPGDVIWWKGHVAIYIGNGKLIHTNTSDPNPSKPQMPTNYIHVSNIKDCRVGSTPTFCRITDNTSILGQGNSSNNVQNAKSVGSVLTESDLTGMVIESSLEAHAEMIKMYGADDLSLVDGNSLKQIKENMQSEKRSLESYLGLVCSLLGLLLLIYGILLSVAIVFDKVNSWIDFSLVDLLSLNRWSLVSKVDIEDGIVQLGYNKGKNKSYLTSTMLVFRICIILVIGMLLICHTPAKILVWLYYKISYIKEYLL